MTLFCKALRSRNWPSAQSRYGSNLRACTNWSRYMMSLLSPRHSSHSTARSRTCQQQVRAHSIILTQPPPGCLHTDDPIAPELTQGSEVSTFAASNIPEPLHFGCSSKYSAAVWAGTEGTPGDTHFCSNCVTSGNDWDPPHNWCLHLALQISSLSCSSSWVRGSPSITRCRALTSAVLLLNLL